MFHLKKVLAVHCGEYSNIRVLLFVPRCYDNILGQTVILITYHNNRGATQQWTLEVTTPQNREEQNAPITAVENHPIIKAECHAL